MLSEGSQAWGASRILVVDDDPDIREVMAEFLKDMGHQVITAEDGLSGLNMAIRQSPDLIILDIDMPGLSGIDICRELRLTEQTRLTPIIIQTGFNDDSTLLAGLEAGCDEFINKPPNIPVLRARVNSLLRISHQRNEIITANNELDLKVRLLEESQTDLQLALKEKEALLKELYHRTKNNMNSITSLLNLQMYQSRDPVLEQAFKVTQNRIRSMALVHKMLYQSKSLDVVSIDDYLKELVRELVYSYAPENDRITVEQTCEQVKITLELAIPVGLIVNEILTNALKYAFPEGARGVISMDARRLVDDQLQITITDNGPGLPPDFDPLETDTLGFKLIRSITEDQLGGELAYQSQGTGLTVGIRFPLIQA